MDSLGCQPLLLSIRGRSSLSSGQFSTVFVSLKDTCGKRRSMIALSSRRVQPAMNTDIVREKVLQVYAEADAAVAAAGPRCDASGRCCRFVEYGHTLFISQFEAEILLESAPGFSTPVSANSCPFQVEGLCTVRDSRPLGCRIYFCDPAYQSRMIEITEKAVAQLKTIAETHGTGWQYASLQHFLNAAMRTPESPTDTMNPPGSRFPLPVVGSSD